MKNKILITTLLTFLIHTPLWAQTPQWTNLLKDLVQINSGTQNTAGLQKVRDRLKPEFEKRGYVTNEINLKDGHKLLVFRTKNSQPKLTFFGHIDTVFKKDGPQQPLTVKGSKIFGPGIIDMKGGIVLMLEILDSLTESEKNQVQIILNDDEEIGSPFSLKTYRPYVKQSQSVLVFEPGLPDGSVVTSESGVYWLELSVKGKSSHAGLEPEKGTNACVQLGHIISLLHKAQADYKGATINSGVIKGGIKPNVVCEEATVKIDIRYVEKEDLDWALQTIRKTAKQNHLTFYNSVFPPQSTIKKIVALPEFSSKHSQSIFERAQKIAQTQNLNLKGVHVGYASDGNQMSDLGVEILVGVGPYGGGMHTDTEFLSIPSFEKRKTWLTQLVKESLK